MFGLLRLLVVMMLLFTLGLMAMAMVAAIVSELIPLLILLAPVLFFYWLIRQGGRARYPQGVERAPRHAPRPRFHLRGAWPFAAPAPEERPAAWVREARGLADDIQRMVRKSDRATRQALTGAPANARKLAERVRDLARLYQTLDEHLRENQPAELSRRAAEMEQRAHRASDGLAREQYLAAVQSHQRQAEICTELARSKERLHAETARIVATLTSLRSRIVATQSGTAPGAGEIDRAAEELAELESQVETFQDSVRQVLPQATRW